MTRIFSGSNLTKFVANIIHIYVFKFIIIYIIIFKEVLRSSINSRIMRLLIKKEKNGTYGHMNVELRPSPLIRN